MKKWFLFIIQWVIFVIIIVVLIVYASRNHTLYKVYYDTGEVYSIVVYDQLSNKVRQQDFYQEGGLKADIEWNFSDNIREIKLFYPNGMLKWHGTDFYARRRPDSLYAKMSRLPALLQISDSLIIPDNSAEHRLLTGSTYCIQTYVDGLHPTDYKVVFHIVGSKDYIVCRSLPEHDGEYVFMTPATPCQIEIIYIGARNDGFTVIGDSPEIRFTFDIDDYSHNAISSQFMN